MIRMPYMEHKKYMMLIGIAGGTLLLVGWYTGAFTIAGAAGVAFSWHNVLLPLLAAVCGSVAMGVFCAANLFMRYLISFAGVQMPLLLGLPTLAAGLYWSTDNKLLRVVLPLACMLLFMQHPVGAQAWQYSLYWLLPATFALLPRSYIFAQAVGSTFMAHAVGSVLFIYTVNSMAADAWLALLPQVALERLTFACGMYLCYYAVRYLYARAASLSYLYTCK